MARLTALPSIQVIRGFKGLIDYYVHQGQPCARRWPRAPTGHRSPAVQATAASFAYVAALLTSVNDPVRDAAILAASQSTLVWRDILIRTYYGRLIALMAIEATGPGGDLLATQTTLASILAQLDAALSTRALEAGGNLASILAQLDVALSTRALESGGNLASILAKLDVALSTRALEAGGNLASILSKLDVALSTRALEAGGNLASILAKLDVALSTRALEAGGVLDELLAQMPALIWGYTDTYRERQDTSSAAGTNIITLSTVPAGEVWIVTGVVARNSNTANTRTYFRLNYDSVSVTLPSHESPAVSQFVGHANLKAILKAGHFLSCVFEGCGGGDVILAQAQGYKMSLT